MLLKDFYSVVSNNSSSNSIEAVVELNKDHTIFKGHFPSQPVVPGVCMVQIVKELTEQKLGTKCRLTESDNIKFLSVIDPNVHSVVNVSISINGTDKGYSLNGSFHSGDITFFKIKATLQPQ